MSRRASSNSSLTRRAFLRSSGAAAGAAVLAGPLAGLQLQQAAGAQPRPEHGYGPLFPTRDRTTGLPLLRLPHGFDYQSFGWSGDPMDDGTPTPDRHDGMAVVESRRGRGAHSELVLIRNHERGPALPGDPLPLVGAGQAPVYDAFRAAGLIEGLGGGTTAVTFAGGRFTGSQASAGRSSTAQADQRRGARGSRARRSGCAGRRWAPATTASSSRCLRRTAAPPAPCRSRTWAS